MFIYISSALPYRKYVNVNFRKLHNHLNYFLVTLAGDWLPEMSSTGILYIQ